MAKLQNPVHLYTTTTWLRSQWHRRYLHVLQVIQSRPSETVIRKILFLDSLFFVSPVSSQCWVSFSSTRFFSSSQFNPEFSTACYTNTTPTSKWCNGSCESQTAEINQPNPHTIQEFIYTSKSSNQIASKKW